MKHRKCKSRPTAIRQPSAAQSHAPRMSGRYGRRGQPLRRRRSENVSEPPSSLPRICVRIAGSVPVTPNGPKPGIAFGSLKSHWFSAMPIKSRIAGSLVQACRSAARVNSAGTRLCRNPQTSVLAVIASIDGRPDGSNGSSAAAFGSRGCAAVASGPTRDYFFRLYRRTIPGSINFMLDI